MPGLELFFYTLIILMASIFASALCLSIFLVSRKRGMLYAAAGFLFYFFDVALVFKDDYLLRNAYAVMEDVYFIGSPLLSIATGGGVIFFLWLIACFHLQKEDPLVKAIPPFLFVAGSLLAYALIPVGALRQFCFYSMRGMILFGMLLVVTAWYRRKPEGERVVLWRFRRLYACLWVLGLAVVAENVVVMFFLDGSTAYGEIFSFFPERNFAENALMLACACFACRTCGKTLSLHFQSPPTGRNVQMTAFIEDGLMAYKAQFGLSNREVDVLRFLLQGMDNQGIASEMNLAVGTVKIHVHNILKKCGQTNRKDLMVDFRMRS